MPQITHPRSIKCRSHLPLCYAAYDPSVQMDNAMNLGPNAFTSSPDDASRIFNLTASTSDSADMTLQAEWFAVKYTIMKVCHVTE